MALNKEEIQSPFLINTTQENVGVPFGLLFIQILINNLIPFDIIKKQALHPLS